ncbi:hypothetical protein J6590_062324 [Homalodisca vitripennis]|nr:hypothetical protein J6590_062324 [Homalodisca vitripennis]
MNDTVGPQGSWKAGAIRQGLFREQIGLQDQGSGRGASTESSITASFKHWQQCRLLTVLREENSNLECANKLCPVNVELVEGGRCSARTRTHRRTLMTACACTARFIFVEFVVSDSSRSTNPTAKVLIVEARFATTTQRQLHHNHSNLSLTSLADSPPTNELTKRSYLYNDTSNCYKIITEHILKLGLLHPVTPKSVVDWHRVKESACLSNERVIRRVDVMLVLPGGSVSPGHMIKLT